MIAGPYDLRKRILIVEDEANERTGLAGAGFQLGISNRHGWRWRRGPGKGWELLSFHRITDIKMPQHGRDGTGGEAGRSSQSIAVVMVTAQKTTETAFHAGRLGVQDYIEKPMTSADCVSILGNIGEISTLVRERTLRPVRLRDKAHSAALVGFYAQDAGDFSPD